VRLARGNETKYISIYLDIRLDFQITEPLAIRRREVF
jgi:hypothetical protein